MRMLLPLGFLLLVLALGPSCGEDVVGPVVPDSTSQDFRFEAEFFDSDGLTWLHDICYINDTCIWAVGWIVKSENGERNVYNAVRWNGKEWLLQQVYDSMPEYSRPLIHTLDAVYGSAPDNIWFACGTLFVHWDGSKHTTVNHLSVDMKGGISECWASGPDNIWMGGMNGELVHFNGRIWKRIKNDIEYEITGIWGNGDTVLIAALERPVFTKTKFYIVVDEKVQFLMEDTSVIQIDAVWFDHLSNIMAEGNWLYHFDGVRWAAVDRQISGKALDMWGNNRSDIAACGHIGSIRHWNGKRWRIWPRVMGLNGALLTAITMHGNKVWAVGGDGTGKKSVIVTGTRPD